MLEVVVEAASLVDTVGAAEVPMARLIGDSGTEVVVEVRVDTATTDGGLGAESSPQACAT